MRKISEMYRRSGGTDYRHLCTECKNLIKGRTYKCRAYGITEGSETDWKPHWRACKFFNRRVSPLIRSEDREIDGQMSLADIPGGDAVKEKILTAITTYIQQHGYPPTVREIGEAVGLKSTSSVYHYLQRMDTAGMIALGNGPRAIKVPGWRFERIKKPAEEGTMRNATPEEQAAVMERMSEI